MGRIAGFPPELADKMRLGQIGPGGQLPHGQRLGIPGLHQTDDGRGLSGPGSPPRPGGIPQQPIKQRRRYKTGGPQFKLARLLRLQAEDSPRSPRHRGGIYRRERKGGRPAGRRAWIYSSSRTACAAGGMQPVKTPHAAGERHRRGAGRPARSPRRRAEEGGGSPHPGGGKPLPSTVISSRYPCRRRDGKCHTGR